MRKTGLGLICWGIVLIALDYQYRGFDLIPDIIGYLLLVLGSRRLIQAEDGHPWYKAGLFLSVASLILSIGEQALSGMQAAGIFTPPTPALIALFSVDGVCFSLFGLALLQGLSVACRLKKQLQAERQCKIYSGVFVPVAAAGYLLSKIAGGTLFTVAYMGYILISIGLLMTVKLVQSVLED